MAIHQTMDGSKNKGKAVEFEYTPFLLAHRSTTGKIPNTVGAESRRRIEQLTEVELENKKGSQIYLVVWSAALYDEDVLKA